jgi:hypothetical protein
MSRWRHGASDKATSITSDAKKCAQRMLWLESRACRIGFMIFLSVLLQDQLVGVLLLKRDLIFWSLVMDEYGGNEDLRGLNRRSIISYVHRKTELYCSSLSCLSLPICLPL